MKQVTPPFKPIVESDESTANFDPEFTTADIREVGNGLDGTGSPDEADPSEDWIQAGTQGPVHTPNGPLGSDRLAISTNHSQMGSNGLGRSQGIQINTRKKHDLASSPLTNSVQENFRGFTYSGESVAMSSGVFGRELESDDEAIDNQETTEVTTEDEFEDESFAGRYSKVRKG